MTKAITAKEENKYSPILIKALANSLYVGAKEESIMMVLDYCKASGLDPMRKPVHIVPMSVKNPVTNRYEWRDVIMPGIGQYRTNAVKTGQYAGVSEPEFGEEVEEIFPEERDEKGNIRPALKMVYPKWCKVTVRRQMSNGTIVEFVAKELWKENYATAGKNSMQPNAMWRKRPYGQLAKCAEAQALRKAFPEFGAQPTAEEMEGKFIDAEIVTDLADGDAEPKKLSELKSALSPLGIEVRWEEGVATATGNTFQNAKILKELGFTVNGKSWVTYCENDLQDPGDTQAPPAPQHEIRITDLAELGTAVEELGGKITAPKANAKGQNWVKLVIDKIDDTATDRIRALGFIKKSSGWVRQVDDLLSIDEDDIPL